MGTAIEPIKEQERQFFQMAAENIGVKYGIDLMVDRVRQMVHVPAPRFPCCGGRIFSFRFGDID